MKRLILIMVMCLVLVGCKDTKVGGDSLGKYASELEDTKREIENGLNQFQEILDEVALDK